MYEFKVYISKFTQQYNTNKSPKKKYFFLKNDFLFFSAKSNKGFSFYNLIYKMSISSREHKRIKIQTFHEAGLSNKEIEQRTGSDSRTVRLWIQRLKEGKGYKTKVRGEYKIKITKEIGEYILDEMLDKPMKYLRDMTIKLEKKYELKVSTETIRRFLIKSGAKSKLPFYKPKLSEKHKQKRLSFAKKNNRAIETNPPIQKDKPLTVINKRRLPWYPEDYSDDSETDDEYWESPEVVSLFGSHERTPKGYDWLRIIFSDESTFQLYPKNNPRSDRVWTKNKIVPPTRTIKYPGGKKGKNNVKIWAAFSAYGKFEPQEYDQLKSADYCGILKRFKRELKTKIKKGIFPKKKYILQQDGASVHCSEETTDFLEKEKIDFISSGAKGEWPACSPDLNPIENLWAILKKRVRRRQPQTREELLYYIKSEWKKIPKNVLENLVYSMPKRLEMVRKNGGDWTPY